MHPNIQGDTILFPWEFSLQCWLKIAVQHQHIHVQNPRKARFLRALMLEFKGGPSQHYIPFYLRTKLDVLPMSNWGHQNRYIGGNHWQTKKNRTTVRMLVKGVDGLADAAIDLQSFQR